jgi:hypothetical protein
MPCKIVAKAVLKSFSPQPGRLPPLDPDDRALAVVADQSAIFRSRSSVTMASPMIPSVGRRDGRRLEQWDRQHP